MSRFKIGSKSQPFPKVRPEISVTPSRAKPIAVDAREVEFAIIPQVGQRSLMAWYDPPGWTLTSVSESVAARPAEIHETECVEIEMYEWEPGSSWRYDWTIFGRLTETAAQHIATWRIRDGKRILYTFLDEGFDKDWGESPRRLADTGRLVLKKDGTYALRKPAKAGPHDDFAAGMFRVRVGRKAFTCLRVIWLGDHHREPEKHAEMAETYLTRSGRTVLLRRYNARLWATEKKGSPYAGLPWDQRFPENQRMVIDGVMYVHWYDCLTGLSCGIE